MATLLTAIKGSSGVIGVLGTISNSVSISYFIGKIRSNGQSANSEGSKLRLYILLSVFDLLVCVLAVGISIAVNIPASDLYKADVAMTLFKVCVFITGFITSLLAVIAAVNVASPLYIVDRKAIYVSVLVFGVIVLIFKTFYNLFAGTIDGYTTENVVLPTEFLIFTWLFLMVIFSNALSIINICQTSSQSASGVKARREAVTVIMLSALFCVCNIGSFAVYGLGLFFKDVYIKTHKYHLELVFNILLLPLNSACNPVVYLARRTDTRAYATVMRRKITGCGVSMKKWVESAANHETGQKSCSNSN